jgi:uncharacterized protein YjdB
MPLGVRLAHAVTLFGSLALSACGDTIEPLRVASVVVNPGATTLVSLDETVQLSASAQDANGNPVPSQTFGWTSSDNGVATVEASTGVVTAMGNGSATIGAMTAGVSGTATVLVDQVVVALQVTPATDTLTALAATVQLTAEATDARGNPVADATLTWETSDASVATVDTSGEVAAVGNGTVAITAFANGASDAADLVVAQQVSTVQVTPETANLEAVGATQQFGAEARDANDNLVSDVPILWLSSDHNVATVDADGLATATGAGSAAITAAAHGIPGTAMLTVMQTATQLAISVQPSDGVAGVALSPAIEVEIQDANGTVVPSARDPVTLAIGTNPGGGTLSGTVTVNAINGVASFSGLSIDKPGTGYTLVATSATLASATSSPFTISAPITPRFVRQVPWTGQGTWLKADTHIHTLFSDGRHPLSEVVERAAAYGCDVVAITDHADVTEDAATPEYFQALGSVRQAYPNMIVLAGIEWNIPPWGGREHATVLVPPTADEARILAEFKDRFDDYLRPDDERPDVTDALRWLAASTPPGGLPPVVIYNHPSRKDATSLENVADLRLWRSVNDLVLGFSGAPGHQGDDPVGSYRFAIQLVDRWDPAAARVGDAWDILLQEGYDIWAARAPSDFHDARPAGLNDFWPCQFSETWLYVPERTPTGVLKALRAGTFFAVHGHIARGVQLTVEVDGLGRAASVGEVIEVAPSTEVTVYLTFSTPPVDWAGNPNHLDAIELIAVTGDGARIQVDRAPDPGAVALSEKIVVPTGGLVLRARGRRVVEGGPDLLFYTNPVRIVAGTAAY